MVVFMLLSATGISSAFASFMAYRKFFTKDLQLRLPQE
jgi:putative ABC transport system permease protein